MQTYRQLKEEMVFKTILIWKMAIASALSWEIAKNFGSDHPYLAPATVIVCLQTTINRSLSFSYHRVTGLVIGIIVADLLLPYLNVSVWTLGITILVACFITKWLRLDESTIHQAGLAVVLIFVIGHNSGDYPLDRFRNTIIGALTACFIHILFFPPNFIKQAAKMVHHLTEELTEEVDRISNWIQTGLDRHEGSKIEKEMEEILIDLHHAHNIIQDTLDSLKFNVFAKKNKKKLEELQEQNQFIAEVYSYLANLLEIFLAWSTEGSITRSQQATWSAQLKAIIPLFQSGTAAKHPLFDKLLKVHISPELEIQQFHLSLYQATKSLLAKLSELK